MADRVAVRDGGAVYGRSLTTTELFTGFGPIDGAWITPCRDIAWTGVLVRYEENNGTTLVDADVFIDVKYADDATAYALQDQGATAWTITGLTGADVAFYRPLAGQADGDFALDLRGISAIRARLTTTGTTHVAGDLVDVTFIGYVLSGGVQEVRRG